MMKIFAHALIALLCLFLCGISTPVDLHAQSRTSSKTVQKKKAKPQKSAKAQKDQAAAADGEESDLGDAQLEKLPGENFSAPWPKFTKIADMLPARIVEEREGHYVYETEHFSFTCTAPINLSAIRDIARIFEGTYTAHLALPLNSPCNYYQVAEKGKLKAYLYETREQYLQKVGPNMQNSAGICRTTNKMETTSILLPFSSLGLEKAGQKYKRGANKVESHVLAHELTHFMTLPGYDYPSWYLEGLAEYVGVTDYRSGRFAFSGNKKELVAYVSGYGEEGGGGRAIGKDIKFSTSLQTFMEQPYQTFLSNPQFNYGFSTLLVYYFFHLDGKKDGARIKAFIRAIQGGQGMEAAHDALLDGRDWARLEKDVARGLRSLRVKVEFPKRSKK